jgi:ribonuclease HI/exonuclease III
MTKCKEKNQFKSFKVLQWNSRSLLANLLQFQHHLLSSDYSVIALQSVSSSFRKLPKFPNYYYPPLFTCDKNSGKVQTAIYIRSDLAYSALNSPELPKNVNSLHFTGVSVKINHQCTLNIVSVYYPQGPKDDDTDWLKHLTLSGGSWLIVGDFNAHAPFWEHGCSVVSSNRLIENIVDSHLFLLNDGSYTRIPDISTQRPTAIDLSFISPTLAVNCTWCVYDDSLGSDHLPIIINLNEEIVDDDPSEDIIPKFSYKKANWEAYQSFLSSFDLDSFISIDLDVDDFYAKFTSKVIQAAEFSIPKCNRKKIGKYSGNSWWNSDCEQAVLNKKRMFKQWLKNKSETNHIEMKRYKLICNRVIAQAKKQHWMEFCEKEISDSKDMFKVWDKIKELKNGYHLQTYPVKLESSVFPTNLNKSEAFLNMFSQNSMSQNLDSEALTYRTAEEQKISYSDPIVNNEHYLNAMFTFDEFYEILQSFSSNNSAVGSDGISYQLLYNLPNKWKQLLFSFFQKCWIDESLPTAWKESIIVPILKQGKPRSALDSYRPVALTSHVSKLFEKIVQRRLIHFCDKNDIIPIEQAGFRRGRCTVDHLVKLTCHIKKQFAHRKSTLATFFDIKKAYDQVWHARLLYKLKNIGLSGYIYSYIKNFLSNRLIRTRVGKVYSSFSKIDMGIPQGSVIAPLLFNILIFDLPKALSKNTNVVQYADDIAIWINTSLRKNSKKRVVKYVETLYQAEIDRVNLFMIENGLRLSSEKTCLMLFNNGQNPKCLPQFELNGMSLQYETIVKFLGVYLSPKLNWKYHINHIISKARKRLNFFKLITSHTWSHDTKNLLHLAISLVRSKLIYGQEVYFSASKSLLKQIQSIDSKAIKLALGVPVHTNTINTYKEVGVLPLSNQRMLAVSKYFLRSQSIRNSLSDELKLNAEYDYPKRAKDLNYLQPIYNYVKDFIVSCDIDLFDVPIVPVSPQIPQWEHNNADYTVNYTCYKKKENPNLITSDALQYINEQYPNHLKIYSDGSVLESADVGCGFVIPDFKIKRSYFLGKHFSIFTAELVGILMALLYIQESYLNISNILLCVDSKSVLLALQNWDCKIRRDLIFEIKALIHFIQSHGVGINFCWIPSHCGILGNEVADALAKQGAQNSISTNVKIMLKKSHHELITILINKMISTFFQIKHEIINCPRKISKLIYKFRLNSWCTKFSENVYCCCYNKLSIQHILFDCPFLNRVFLAEGVSIDRQESLYNVVHSSSFVSVARLVLSSPVGKLL